MLELIIVSNLKILEFGYKTKHNSYFESDFKKVGYKMPTTELDGTEKTLLKFIDELNRINSGVDFGGIDNIDDLYDDEKKEESKEEYLKKNNPKLYRKLKEEYDAAIEEKEIDYDFETYLEMNYKEEVDKGKKNKTPKKETPDYSEILSDANSYADDVLKEKYPELHKEFIKDNDAGSDFYVWLQGYCKQKLNKEKKSE